MRRTAFRSVVVGCALAAWVSFTGSMALAQSDTSSDGEARALFEEGRSAYERGAFEDAVRAFRRAYLLSPRYALLYNIGQSELRAGHDPEALEALEAFLRQAPPDDHRRSEVEERVRMLRGMGVVPGHSTAGAEPTTGASTSTVRASEPPDAATGGSGEATADSSAAAPRSQPLEPSPASEEEGSAGPSVAPWIVVGVGGALVVAGAVLMGVGASDAERLAGAPMWSRWSEYEGLGSSAETMWGVGIALLGVGIAGAAAGVVWALLPSGSDHHETARLRLGPASLFIEGEF